MPVNRFYIDQALRKDDEVILKDEERRHLNVLRYREGDIAELVNGQGALAQAKLISLTKSEAVFQIQDLFLEAKKDEPLILIQALPKMNRLDTILEKGTELGMDEIRLFPGDLSEKMDLSANQRERAEHIVLSALKQCGRLFLPKISFFSDVKAAVSFEGTLFFGDVNVKAPPLLSLLKKSDFEKPIGFAVGPESGFSETETNFLKTVAKGVKLHQNILRTDTAPLIALSLLHHARMVLNT